MKTRLYLALSILISLTACQNEEPASQHSTSSAPVSSTVAVTKAAIETDVKDLQANIAEGKEAITKAAAQLTEPMAESVNEGEIASEVAKGTATAKAVAAAKAAETVKAAAAAAKAEKAAAAVKASEVAKAAAAITTNALTTASPLASGNAGKGKSLANKCKGCHNFTAKKKVGPGLKGVVGRKAGTMAGARYSAALASADWVWNEKNLAIWLCDSKKAVKTLSGNSSAKTKMPAQRICDANKQADLIAFLNTL